MINWSDESLLSLVQTASLLNEVKNMLTANPKAQPIWLKKLMMKLLAEPSQKGQPAEEEMNLLAVPSQKGQPN